MHSVLFHRFIGFHTYSHAYIHARINTYMHSYIQSSIKLFAKGRDYNATRHFVSRPTNFGIHHEQL